MATHTQTGCQLGGLIIVASALLGGCGGSGGTATTSTDPSPKPWALHAATDTGLTAYFRDALGPTSKSYLGSVWALDGALATASTAPVPGAAAAVFSGTTLQEVGVDEADRIKSDGVFIYDVSAAASGTDVLRRQRLDATSADAKLQSAGTLTVPFTGGVRASGIYLDSDRGQLAVLGEGSSGGAIYANWFAPQWWGQGITEVALVNTSATDAMQTRRKLRITARLIGSRRIASTLYLVLRSYPQVVGIDPLWPAEKTATNQQLLNTLQASQLLPTLSIDGGAAQPLVQASECLTQEQNAIKSADVITLVGIDLASATQRHAARCFTGGSEAFYMADQSLYLATTRSAYSYAGAFPVYATQTSTDLHKFALDGLNIAYRGSGNVTGHLGFDQNRKSFRMGEYQGALRVITQTQPSWSGWLALPPVTGSAVESPGHLSILIESAGALNTVGELPNSARPQPLGKPGEQLYASRFIGKRGYLVTYRLTDPLYVLDLSNPTDPKVAGSLQVDGYSDYLFPVSENLLLGVGKDAVSDGSSGDGRFAWYQGVKVSLIDVTDPSTPREAARSIIGKRGTDATVLRDHHGIALQTLGNTVRVSLPVSLHDRVTPGMTGAPNNYYGFTRTELQRFELSLASPSLVEHPAMASSVPGERDIGNDRSLLWNNQLHWYQNGSWRSGAW